MNKIAKHNVESPLLKKAGIKESDVVRKQYNPIFGTPPMTKPVQLSNSNLKFEKIDCFF